MRNPIAAASGALALVVAIAAPAPAQIELSGATSYNFAWQWFQAGQIPGAQFDSYLCDPEFFADLEGSCGQTGLTVANTSSAELGGTLKVRSSLGLTGYTPEFAEPLPIDVWGHGVTSTSGAEMWDQVRFEGVVPDVLRFNYGITGTKSTVASDGTSWLRSTGRIYFGASQEPQDQRWSIFEEEVYGIPMEGTTSRGAPEEYYGFRDMVVLGSDPMTFYLSLLATATISGSYGSALNGLVDSDFSHTVHWGVQALDADGNDITEHARMSFASGAQYETTVTPEPVSMALLGTGLAGLGAVRRRRRKEAEVA